jgi:hypothetical protein
MQRSSGCFGVSRYFMWQFKQASLSFPARSSAVSSL